MGVDGVEEAADCGETDDGVFDECEAEAEGI